MSDMEPITLTAPPVVNLLSLNDTDGNPIVTIGPDGTVRIFQLGAEPKAAKVFWDAIHIHGVTLFNQIENLKQDLKIMRQRLEGDIRVIQRLNRSPQ
jgi:hypothetical protein